MSTPISIAEAAKILGRHGIEAGFVLPTATAMEKGIMDATWPLREYLLRTGVHDYVSQGQGPAAKRILSIEVIQSSLTVAGEMSLYRPETKQGDPRLWIYGLQKFAAPNELIALIVDNGKIYALNCAREDMSALLLNPATVLGRIAARLDVYADIASELIKKLKAIGELGFLESMRAGDTGIGYTLETLLGIEANSNQAPDYHGIELKSGRLGARVKPAAGRHITLFSKTPEWAKSSYTARRALETFGYRDETTGRLQLFCSVDAKQKNSLGFQLKVNPENDSLTNSNLARIPAGEEVFLWFMESLRQSFSSKHRETFWIGAQTKKLSGVEHFHFTHARHTRKPPLATFERLLADGGICVDLTMSEKGQNAVRDHGYLFRIYGNRFDELFPEVGAYSLVP